MSSEIRVKISGFKSLQDWEASGYDKGDQMLAETASVAK